MATLAELLSVPTEIKHTYEGVEKTYPLDPPGLLQQGKFQRFLEQKAREVVERGAYSSEDARDKAMNLVTRDATTGYYEWEGPGSVDAMCSLSGLAKYLEIVLEIPAKEAASLAAARHAMIAQLVRGARANDPKLVRAVLTMLGLPADFLKRKSGSSSGSARREKPRRRKSKR